MNVAQDLNVMRDINAIRNIRTNIGGAYYFGATQGITQTLVIGACMIDVNGGIITKAVGC